MFKYLEIVQCQSPSCDNLELLHVLCTDKKEQLDVIINDKQFIDVIKIDCVECHNYNYLAPFFFGVMHKKDSANILLGMNKDGEFIY